MTGARDAVAARGAVGYKGPLSRPPGGTKEERFVAAKTPAKKAASAAKKSAKPVSKKVVENAVSKAPAKPVAKPAVKKAAAPSAAKPTAKKAPAAAGTPKPAPPKAPAASSRAKAGKHSPVTTPQVRNTVPAVKSTASSSAKGKAPHAASRSTGKVAVAVTARQPAPVPKSQFKVIEYKTDPVTGRPILPAGYRPSAEEEYMSPLQLEYFRQRLLKWRADLVEESKQTIENLRGEVRDIGDEAERATRETENSLELRTRDRYRKLIGKIDSTLKRLDAGDYGYCVDTGEEIGLDRLEARLTAERTLDAQERWEHLQKQQGE